jgi:hypothetical protein
VPQISLQLDQVIANNGVHSAIPAYYPGYFEWRFSIQQTVEAIGIHGSEWPAFPLAYVLNGTKY